MKTNREVRRMNIKVLVGEKKGIEQLYPPEGIGAWAAVGKIFIFEVNS
jgi:hypothetical protein